MIMTTYQNLQFQLADTPKTWLVTGVAGFIGSHLLETLLKLDQNVIGLDNFSTGKPQNFDEVRAGVRPSQWRRFRFIEGDTRVLRTCRAACAGADYVLHQAALGSVPRSIDNPLRSHDNNVNGFLNMLVAAKETGISRFVYASSSSVYGDHPNLPKQEHRIGRPLSPYAATKRVTEIYADTFARCYGMQLVGLRYFNVFGPRQDPQSPYSAVIPIFVSLMLAGQRPVVYGDGLQSRDFVYVGNVVQANLLAAEVPGVSGQVFNVGVGRSVTLLRLLESLNRLLGTKIVSVRPNTSWGG